jgi:hypothetical protein
MMQSKIFHIIALSVLSIASAFGQGMVFNDSIKAQLFSNYEKAEVSRAPLPSSFSLKAYAPYVHYQLGSECVAYSFATAHTILMAIAYDWQDQKYISINSFSPHFIYYRNKDRGDDECTIGLDPFKVSQDAIAVGMAKLSDVECPDYYPCSMEQRLCSYYPPSYAKDLSGASYHKLDEIYMIEDMQQLRTALASSRPVVVGMMVPESFRTTGVLWTPKYGETPETGYGHAMVAVAYDDYKYGGAVQLMNSWGTEWGDGGFAWVKYDDLLKFVQFGLALDRSIGRYKAEAPDAKSVKTQYSEIKEIDISLLKQDTKLGTGLKLDSAKTDYLQLQKSDFKD